MIFMKTKFIFFCFLFICAYACNRKPYVEHKLKFEKVSEDCKDQQSYFRLNSNFGGERFEFEKCLPGSFTANDLISSRSNDTVYINFKTAERSDSAKVYHLTLDIDSYPKYSFINIAGDIYVISPTQK